MKVLLFLLFPLCLHGQKVSSEIDKFTKQRRVKTTSVELRHALLEGIGLRLRSVDTTIFLIIDGYGAGADIIGSNDRAMLLLDNEETIIVVSTGIQDYSIGTGWGSDSYNHQYSISVQQVQTLAAHEVKSIRKYGADGYVDIDISEKNRYKSTKLAAAFLKEYNKP